MRALGCTQQNWETTRTRLVTNKIHAHHALDPESRQRNPVTCPWGAARPELSYCLGFVLSPVIRWDCARTQDVCPDLKAVTKHRVHQSVYRKEV